MLIGVIVREYYGFHPFSLCKPFFFGFVWLEVVRSFDLTAAKFFQELHNFFKVVVGKGVVVFCKVFPNHCDAFLV